MRQLLAINLLCISLLDMGSALAAETSVNINAINETGVGAAIGTIQFTDSADGLRIRPNLSGLSAGEHGFHVHENADCGAAIKDNVSVAGLAAGGHYDPSKTGQHLGPAGQGHHGDLPALIVNENGHATASLLAPHLTLADIQGHAIIIHAGADNYSDTPKPLGGGGARVACGIISVVKAQQ